MSRGQIIHSGHFMCSNLHDDAVPGSEDEEDVEVDVVEDDEKSIEASSSTHKNKVLDEKPVTFYKFGVGKTQSIAIDVSLNKLNKCIKVAYNKMTTPKWKDFKGLRLHWKQRIRLNNVIWRAYYIEFRKKQPQKPKKPFCYFAVPDDDTTHQKIEGSIVEGMYWKRKMEGVCAQYKRWRIRSKHNLIAEKGGMIAHCSSSSMTSLSGDFRRKRKANSIKEPVDSLARSCEPPAKLQRSQTPKHTISDEFAWDLDDLDNVFTDDFLNSLSEPYMFPDPRDPRDVYGGNNADIMQPGLLPLQPTIEEIMMSLGDMPESPPPTTSAPQPPPQMRRSASSSASLHQMQVQQPQQQQQPQPQKVEPQPPSIQHPIARPPTQDFMTSSLMMDYRMMPTRQSSAITSQMLMLSQSASTSTTQLQYATASHYNNSFLPVRHTGHWNGASKPQQNFLVNSLPQQSHVERILNNQPVPAPRIPTQTDPYMPQFLQSPAPQVQVHDPMMAPSRSWWLDSPLTASVQSPLSVSTPLPLANQSGPSTPFLNGLKGPTLSQRLEQPPIVTTKVFTSLTPTPSPLDFTSLSRLRTNSLNEPWKVVETPTPKIIPPEPVAPAPQPQRQQSCDSKMKSEEKKPEVVKEEPMPMSAPSSVKSMRKQAPDSTLHPEERKRILHLHAEQNRRSALKDGFDQLMDIIPNLYSGGVKPTNAVVLAKAADHIRRLQNEKWEKTSKIEEAKGKIEKLNQRIASLQSNLPQSSAASSSSQVDAKTSLETFYERYTKEQAKKDWRFWVMCQMLKPLCVSQSNSFASSIAGDSSSRNEVAATCSDWLNKNWKATELRPLASTLLVSLATNSSILAEPETLPDYVMQQLKNPF